MSSASLPRSQRVLGCLLGVAVGDAFGLPFEFMSRAEILERHGPKPVTEIIGGGWSHAEAGAVTDDTEMTVLLAESLIANAGYDRAAAAGSYLDWAGAGSPYVGRIVKSVLLHLNEGVPLDQAAALYHEQSGGQTAGNGALMRIAPLAISYADDTAALTKHVTTETLLTHHHPLAVEASLVYAAKLAALLTGAEPEPIALSEETRAAVEASPAEATRRIHSEGGFVLATLAASFAALQFDSFEKALLWLANEGGDADTNAACAGALLGARDGAGAIPERWLAKLRVRAEIELLAAQLSG